MSYALVDLPNEKGATKRRCVFKTIDWSKGTGIGYIAKYISKNIDGEHIDKDLNGQDAKKSALRVSAWASIHKIRQFQQFGGPSVTCWRELRKITTVPEGPFEEAHVAADSGNWELFTNLFGGTQIDRKDQPIKPLREFSDECGRYGEPKGNQIVGVTNGVENLVTRIHQWTTFYRVNQTGMPGPAGLAG
ncbi:MAG: replication endonuclease [Gammaproteobacteria bacterium]|nr:replication endonuclease [Gammaproteobacteria bacterium]